MFSKLKLRREKKNFFFLNKIKVDEFILMTDEEKTKLKWTYLLEKLRFGIQVIQFKSYFSIIILLF
jgi:hypothetical protein